MLIPGVSSVSFELDSHSLNAAGEYFMKRLAWLCGALILSTVIIVLLARFVLPGFTGFNRFVLTGHEQEGYIAGDCHLRITSRRSDRSSPCDTSSRRKNHHQLNMSTMPSVPVDL